MGVHKSFRKLISKIFRQALQRFLQTSGTRRKREKKGQGKRQERMFKGQTGSDEEARGSGGKEEIQMKG